MSAYTRGDFRDAVMTLMAAQQAATPTLLRKTARYNPGGMSGEKPVAWIGEITDELEYTPAQRFRTMTADGQIATTFPADTPTDDFDDLMDAILERFTAASGQVGTGSILEITRIEPNDVSITSADGNTAIYRGAAVTYRLRIWETRV